MNGANTLTDIMGTEPIMLLSERSTSRRAMRRYVHTFNKFTVYGGDANDPIGLNGYPPLESGWGVSFSSVFLTQSQ